MEIKLYKPIDKVKEFEGALLSFDKDMITIEADGEQKSFSRNDIAVIKLALDF